MKKLHAVLFGLGLAFLVYLVATIGVGKLWRELASLGWGLVPFILCEGVAEMVHTAGWRHCLSGPLRSLRMATLFRIRMAGYAINYLTPTAALGGELTRVALLASHHKGPEAVTGVLIEKVCFALAHLVFVVAGSLILLWRIELPQALWGTMLVSSTIVAIGIIAFLLLQKHGKLGGLIRWLAARDIGGSVLKRVAADFTRVDEALQVYYRERPWDLARAVCWHLAGYSVGIAQTWFFFHLLGQNISWGVAAGAWLLGMWFDLLTFAVPMNVGSLEGTRIVVFKALGYGALLGMTYGIALRFTQLFWAGFGLVGYALAVRKRVVQRSDTIPEMNGQEPGALNAMRMEQNHRIEDRDLVGPKSNGTDARRD